MVVILADLRSPELQQLDQSKLRESWRTSEDFFHRMAEHDPDTYAYFRGLETISRFIRTDGRSMSLHPPLSYSSGDPNTFRNLQGPKLTRLT
jgi:hypothetical protein